MGGTIAGQKREAQKTPACSILDILDGLNVSLLGGEYKILLLKCFERTQRFKYKAELVFRVAPGILEIQSEISTSVAKIDCLERECRWH